MGKFSTVAIDNARTAAQRAVDCGPGVGLLHRILGINTKLR